MVQLNENFEDLLIVLADEGADFLLIGGWAMALHGHGRGTDDIDIWVRPEPDNAIKGYCALLRFGARCTPLLKNKRSAGRPKDLADVAWLEAHPESTDE